MPFPVRELVGAGLGGIGGGFLGRKSALSGSERDRRDVNKRTLTGALVGAGLGGIVGHAFGSKLRDQYRQEAELTARQAKWKSDSAANHKKWADNRAKWESDFADRKKKWGFTDEPHTPPGSAHHYTYSDPFGGYRPGGSSGRSGRYNPPHSGSAKSVPEGYSFNLNTGKFVKIPDYAKNIKTKSEAKSGYQAEAFKHHPDRGGDVAKMKDINSEWTAYEGSEHHSKLASVMSESFLEELLLILKES